MSFFIMFSLSQQICCKPIAFNFDSQFLNKTFLFYAWHESWLMFVSHLLVTDRICKNCDEVLPQTWMRIQMAMGLSRLKGLALDLNAELDEHDDILIRLDDKASRTGIKVEKQNKDMSKILKKWAFFITLNSITANLLQPNCF